MITDESEVVVRWMLSSLPEGNPGARFNPQAQQLPWRTARDRETEDGMEKHDGDKDWGWS